MIGCADEGELSDAQLSVSLITPLQRNMVKDQEFRIVVDLNASGRTIPGVRVVAEVLDAVDASVGEFVCKAAPGKPGQYESEVFVPPETAKPGTWKVSVTASRGDSTLADSTTVQVEDSLGKQVWAKHGFYLDIPPYWSALDQQATTDVGFLLLDPMPADDAEAQLEIHYVRGKVRVDKGALHQFMLSYHPRGYDKGESYVRQIIPVRLQGHEGFLGRGGFVTSGGEADYNFAVQMFLFYCDESDRTFTVITASTSDTVMSQMAAMLDEFKCHGGPPSAR